MMEFLRKLFRRKPPPPPTEYTDGLFELAMKRSEEKLPCCGGMRRSHAEFRSGELLCPIEMTIPAYLRKVKVDLRYNPLECDECFFPPWSEKHFKCTTCGCARGVHRSEGHKRTTCTDPDCPGCPTGCT